MDRPRGFALFMLIPTVIGVAISRVIGWDLWNGLAFTVGLVTLVYSVPVWLGAEPPVRLEAPLIGVPIVIALGAVLWWTHIGSGRGDARIVTLMMQVLVCAPFVALTVLGLFRLD